MNNSIFDIEVTILKVFNDRNGLLSFLSRIEKDERMVVKDPNDPIFIEELSFFLKTFQDNNGGTLEKLLTFKLINRELRDKIKIELKKLN